MSLRFWRLPLRFDARALQAELAQLSPADWQQHFNTGYHDGGWSGAALISADGDAHRLYAGHDGGAAGVPTPLLAMCPMMAAALTALPGEPRSARLLRLAPGAVIRQHSDHGLGLDEGLVRLHIPIVSHPEVEFYVDGVAVPMAAGECWYLDLSLPHRVQNLGTGERVHLVVDIGVEQRLLDLLPPADEGERLVQQLRSGLDGTSQQRFDRFRAEVLADESLQAALWDCEDPDAFVDRVSAAGAGRGHLFTAEDVRAAMQAGRRAWLERHLC